MYTVVAYVEFRGQIIGRKMTIDAQAPSSSDKAKR
jgi:hypothetical protein